MITNSHLKQAMGYAQYLHLLEKLMADGKTTGDHQTEEYVNYAKLNLQRMHRLNKTIVLMPEIISVLNNITGSYTWVLLTEGWCGDAAQNIPVFAALENACSHLSLKLLLRDENLSLMDQYLTDNSRSIPKLICVDTETLKEIFTWGPRPAEVQQIMLELKKQETPLAEKSLQIQKWYNNDKTLSLQRELLVLLKKLS